MEMWYTRWSHHVMFHQLEKNNLFYLRLLFEFEFEFEFELELELELELEFALRTDSTLRREAPLFTALFSALAINATSCL